MMCQQFTNANSFIMLQFGIAILNYLDDLAGAEKKEKATFAYNCLEQVSKNVELRNLQTKLVRHHK